MTCAQVTGQTEHWLALLGRLKLDSSEFCTFQYRNSLTDQGSTARLFALEIPRRSPLDAKLDPDGLLPGELISDWI